MDEQPNYHLFLKKEVGNGQVKYMRIITAGNQINYVEVTMEGDKPSDYKESNPDQNFVDTLLAEPGVVGFPPILFSGKTGLPLV
jgi:thioredoxin-related protein